MPSSDRAISRLIRGRTCPNRAATMKPILLTLGLILPVLAACGGENQRLVQNDEYGDYRRGAVRQRPLGTSAGIVIFGVDKEREAREAAAIGGSAGLSVN